MPQIYGVTGPVRAAGTAFLATVMAPGLPARERSWQPEPGEHAVLEAGQGADPVAGESEHVEAGAVADAGGRAQVGAERRLAVGSRGHEVEPAPGVEQAGAEARHHVPALVFEGDRR